MSTDSGFIAAMATIGTAVVTYLLAPIIKKLMSRDERNTNIEIVRETAAVKALRSALDGLQEENARLREAVSRQDSRIETLNTYISHLEAQQRSKEA